MIASLPWLGAAVVLLWAGIDGGARVAEMRRARALPPIDGRTPNVLLVVLDTVRADHLSVYGYERTTTPNLARFAQDGVVFDHAVSASSWTLPGHASLFTGRSVHEHQADSEHPVLDGRYPTLAEVLAARGFATAGFSANTGWATRNAGLARGFLHFEDYFESVADAVVRTVIGREVIGRIRGALGIRGEFGRPKARDITNAFDAWVDGVRGRPFFAFLNYMDAHGPYHADYPFQTQFMTPAQREAERGHSFKLPALARQAAPGEQALFTAAYDGALAGLDAELENLFDKLHQKGLDGNTIVVVVADHGEALGDHGFYIHGHSLYMDQIHVPLIVRWPGKVPSGVRVPAAVSTTRVPATILDLVGMSTNEVPGQSLASLWLPGGVAAKSSDPVVSEVGHRDGVPAEWPISSGVVRSIVSGPWHLIAHRDGRLELFRFRDDTGEKTDLASSAEGRSVAQALHQKLDALLTADAAGAPDRAMR